MQGFGLAGYGMTYPITDIGMLAIATGTVSVALANSHLTKPVRLRILDYPLIGELANCSFCLGFWIALALTFIHYGAIAIMQWMTVWGLGALWSGILLKLYLFRESENEELRELVRELKETVNDLVGEA